MPTDTRPWPSNLARQCPFQCPPLPHPCLAIAPPRWCFASAAGGFSRAPLRVREAAHRWKTADSRCLRGCVCRGLFCVLFSQYNQTHRQGPVGNPGHVTFIRDPFARVTDGALNREFVYPAFGRGDRTLAPLCPLALCLLACLPACLPACPPARLPACLPACLSACVRACPLPFQTPPRARLPACQPADKGARVLSACCYCFPRVSVGVSVCVSV